MGGTYIHVRNYNGKYPTTMGVCYSAVEWKVAREVFLRKDWSLDSQAGIGKIVITKVVDGYHLTRLNTNGGIRELTLSNLEHQKLLQR